MGRPSNQEETQIRTILARQVNHCIAMIFAYRYIVPVKKSSSKGKFLHWEELLLKCDVIHAGHCAATWPIYPNEPHLNTLGLKVPCTISVKNSENTPTPKLLGFRVHVFGTTSEIKHESICDDCQKKENKPGSLSLVDFRPKSDVVFPLSKSDDRSIFISFSFYCYPKDYNNDSQYRYVIRLRYSSQNSQSIARRCSYVNKNHKTLLLFSIASRILSILSRSGPETTPTAHSQMN